MTRFRERIQKHKVLAWILTLAYIVFQGCFSFPFSNELFPLTGSKAVILLIGYGLIGFCFAGILLKKKGLIVWLLSLIFTGIGLLCRYALEYGEVSNTMNFIPQSILSYLIVVPLYCTVAYWCIHMLDGKKQSS